MLNGVQHDSEEVLLDRGSFIAGGIPSLQDDKERELVLGKGAYSSTLGFLVPRKGKAP